MVCIDGWHEVRGRYARQYGITKLKWIVSGGGDGQESTRNGIEALREVCDEKDVILVHDAVRPFLPAEVITDAIVKQTEGIGTQRGPVSGDDRSNRRWDIRSGRHCAYRDHACADPAGISVW